MAAEGRGVWRIDGVHTDRLVGRICLQPRRQRDTRRGGGPSTAENPLWTAYGVGEKGFWNGGGPKWTAIAFGEEKMALTRPFLSRRFLVLDLRAIRSFTLPSAQDSLGRWEAADYCSCRNVLEACQKGRCSASQAGGRSATAHGLHG